MSSRNRNPNTQLRQARAMAVAHGLALDIAGTTACAERNGVYWLTDPVVHQRVFQSDDVAAVLRFLRTYRPAPVRPPLLARARAWLGLAST